MQLPRSRAIAFY